MLFTSFEFLFVFLPVTFLAVRAIWQRRGRGPALYALLACSLVFYAWDNPAYLLLFLAVIVASHAVAGRVANGAHRGRWLALGVAINLAPLLWFKYWNFLTGSINAVAGTGVPAHDLYLPLGISFFTFQQMLWLIDIYRREAGTENLRDHTLFISFFPQLLSGPIMKHRELMPQLQRLSVPRVGEGYYTLAIGFLAFGTFKKLVIANYLWVLGAPFIAGVADGYQPGFVEAWVNMMALAAFIYFDYSAYSDLAIGLGLLLGIQLPINFAAPYQADSVRQFWRRWNTTLMRFLREAVYLPVKTHWGTTAASFVTMIACGAWHGAGWNFLIWGFLVAVLLTAERMYARAGIAAGNWPGKKPLARAWVCIAYVVPLAVFLMPDPASIGRTVMALFGVAGNFFPAQVQNHLPTWIALPGAEFAMFFPLRVELVLLVGAWLVIWFSPPSWALLAYRVTIDNPPGAQLQRTPPDAVPATLQHLLVRPAGAVALAAVFSVSLSWLAADIYFFYFQF